MSSVHCSRSNEEKGELFDEEINLNVGGTLFTTSLATLTRFPDTMLGAMFSGRHELHKNAAGAYFIDRDGLHFREILNFLRAPAEYDQTAMSERAKVELAKELEYYGLTELVASVLAARVAEMPVQPTPPVKMRNKDDLEITVSQGTDGIWTAHRNGYTGYPGCAIQICRNCGCGHYMDRWTNQHAYIPNFTFGREFSQNYPCITTGTFSYQDGKRVLSQGRCKICEGK